MIRLSKVTNSMTSVPFQALAPLLTHDYTENTQEGCLRYHPPGIDEIDMVKGLWLKCTMKVFYLLSSLRSNKSNL